MRYEVSPAHREHAGPGRHSVWAFGREKRSLSARLGDSFYFAVSKIVESLLRRGAHPSGVLLACRWQPALSARWRILAKQLTLFRQYPTPVIARGPSYPDELELRSGRAGRPYAGRARPKGVLLACRERKSVSVRAPAKSYSNAEHAFEQFRYLGAARGLPLRRAGGASRHSALAIRLQKHSSSARHAKAGVGSATSYDYPTRAAAY